MLGKLVFICILNLMEYKNNQGLLKELYEFSFPIVKTNEELITNIETYNIYLYSKMGKKYFDTYPFYDKGDIAQKMVQ